MKAKSPAWHFPRTGSVVASGSADGTIRLWGACNGAQLTCMRGHEGPVTSVAFSPDGQRIASGSVDKTVRTWDAAAGTERACLRLDDPGVWSSGWSAEKGEYVTYGVSAVAFTAGGQQIVTLSRPGTLFLSEKTHTSRVWDERSGVCLKTLQGVGSFPALCAGNRRQAVLFGPEVEIKTETGQMLGWFPAALESLTAHPSGRIWAGSSGKHLYHFALEGS